LKNPLDVPPRKFALRAESQAREITCFAESGPNMCHLVIGDQCNAYITSCMYQFGTTYTNDAGFGDKFFTGSTSFQVEEIEISEITS
jgi:hypothetical protein